jgi:hypothetical protein
MWSSMNLKLRLGPNSTAYGEGTCSLKNLLSAKRVQLIFIYRDRRIGI